MIYFSEMIKPLGDKILVEISKEASEKVRSGIIVPGDDKGTKVGIVIAVSDGTYDNQGKKRALMVKEGDKIAFSWGDPITHEGKEYEIVSESSVLGILQ